MLAFDGLMVARGDLGVELALEQVPLVQKRTVQIARENAKPVIVATHMLDSMIVNSRQIDLYRRLYDQMWQRAATGSEATALIQRVAAELRGLSSCR